MKKKDGSQLALRHRGRNAPWHACDIYAQWVVTKLSNTRREVCHQCRHHLNVPHWSAVKILNRAIWVSPTYVILCWSYLNNKFRTEIEVRQSLERFNPDAISQTQVQSLQK